MKLSWYEFKRNKKYSNITPDINANYLDSDININESGKQNENENNEDVIISKIRSKTP